MNDSQTEPLREQVAALIKQVVVARGWRTNERADEIIALVAQAQRDADVAMLDDEAGAIETQDDYDDGFRQGVRFSVDRLRESPLVTEEATRG